MIGKRIAIKRDLFHQSDMADKQPLNIGTKEEPVYLPTGLVLKELRGEFLCKVGPHQLVIGRKEIFRNGDNYRPYVPNKERKYLSSRGVK